MGAADSMPERITEAQAKHLAGELWNQYIFDSLVDEDGFADKTDVVDAASEALMAFQGESVEIMRVSDRRKKGSVKKFSTNEELGKKLFDKRNGRQNGPAKEICKLAHSGNIDDMVALVELSEYDVLDLLDPNIDRTALQIACTYHFMPICEYLIEKGCLVNKQNKDMKTALHFAAQIGNWDIVTLLVKSGADTDIKDNMERFPGDYVESDYSGHGFIKQDISRFPEMLALLNPKKKGNVLYNGPRQGTENDPPNAEVVAVEITKENFQISKNGQSGHARTSRSFQSASDRSVISNHATQNQNTAVIV